MRICVLLAAFKGERYIEAQIFSILNQCAFDIDLFVRVDGKVDKTHEIVKRLSREYDNIFYIPGDVSSSSGKNFVSQILSINFEKYSFVCLSDQDDYWRSDKINYVLEKLRDDKSSCFSSNFYSFTQSGKIRLGRYNKITELDYFFQCAGPGCSFVLTAEAINFAKKEIQDNEELLAVSAHDWLIYFILRLNNFSWTYEDEALFFYRQHANNIAGENRGVTAKLKRLKVLLNGWYGNDLVVLHTYAAQKELLHNSFSPLKCRRSRSESVVMWAIYKLFLQKKVRIF